MSNAAERFRALHAGSGAFIMPNAWDGASAVLMRQAGFAALGTSSAAIAWALGRSSTPIKMRWASIPSSTWESSPHCQAVIVGTASLASCRKRFISAVRSDGKDTPMFSASALTEASSGERLIVAFMRPRAARLCRPPTCRSGRMSPADTQSCIQIDSRAGCRSAPRRGARLDPLRGTRPSRPRAICAQLGSDMPTALVVRCRDG